MLAAMKYIMIFYPAARKLPAKYRREYIPTRRICEYVVTVNLMPEFLLSGAAHISRRATTEHGFHGTASIGA